MVQIYTDYELVAILYNDVKQDIKYASPYWGNTIDTLHSHRGHCGMKSELLVRFLRNLDIEARYVEGRYTGLPKTLVSGMLAKLGFTLFEVHFWVEACVDDEWITLDPTPDRGIVDFIGDTDIGTHLGVPGYITRWDELPCWYKDVYNCRLLLPLRTLSDFELSIRRLLGKLKSKRRR